MNNSSTEETQKPFSFEDYEIKQENSKFMQQDLLKRFPIGSKYALSEKELLQAGANVKSLTTFLIEKDKYHPKSKMFYKDYPQLLWKDIGWIIIIDTDGEIIKRINVSAFGLTLK